MSTRLHNINAIIVLVFLLITTLVSPAGAQENVSQAARVQVDLWPDYDQAAVLVLVTAELPADAPLPTSVSLIIPPDAGEPTAVAYEGTDGELMTAVYNTRSVENGTLVTAESESQTLRFEYYYPYSESGNEVSFEYAWLGGVGTDDLTILLRRPDAATSINPGPHFQETGVLNDGNTYYAWAAGPVEPTETRTATISYRRATSSPAAAVNSGSKNNALAVVLAAGGGLLLGLGAGLYWPWRNARPATSRNRSVVRPSRPIVPKRSKTGGSAFCHSCGSRLKPEDQFCRQCGQRVK
jgi:hypothetical protein